MGSREAIETVRLHKIKRPGGVFWYDLRRAGHDLDGTWLRGPTGLELDPVLHEPDGRVEIEDWDEYEDSCRNGWMNSNDAKLARTTAHRCAELLRQGTEPWLRRGWEVLRQTM